MPAIFRGASPARRELTLVALILGFLLSAVLSAANAYLGLFAGMTVSASIPAAVISMGLLRAVRGGILENNLVQTAASAGESAAAGAIFTLPAMILLGAWQGFPFLLCAVLVFLGGFLGVLFTVFLRLPLVVEGSLPYPEGVATAHVLRVGHGQAEGSSAGRGLRFLGLGGALGALAKWLESGLGWSRSVVEGALSAPFGHFYWGTGTAPALVAVGHIVGLRAAALIFSGGVVNWVLVLPFVTDVGPEQEVLGALWDTWSEKTRYLGVGAMTVGGLGTLFSIRQSISYAVSASWSAVFTEATSLRHESEDTERDRDLPMRLVLGGILASVLPLVILFHHITGAWGLSCLITVLVLVFGFLFSSVAAYMAGLVGSSNNPVSGVTIATILLTSLLLSWLGVEAVSSSVVGAAGPAAAILVGTIVCTAAAIGGDNLQDLKAGHLLGATPFRQQIMQLVGVFAAALVMAPVLSLLLSAYGFGSATQDHPAALRAPQATLMASVAEGVFFGQLPWNYVIAGALIGVGLVVLDEWLARRRSAFRIPPLTVALGLYLPWEMSGPVLLGALLGRARRRTTSDSLLGAAGLITGEALTGIVLAFVVTIGGGVASPRAWDSPWLGIAILFCSVFFVRLASSSRSAKGE